MNKTTKLRIFVLILLTFNTGIAFSQQHESVDYKKYSDFKYSALTTTDSLFTMSVFEQTKRRVALSQQPRPPYWNNAKFIHFPAVLKQKGESCTSTSWIGYIFTHEINSLRNADASQPENIYPSHFTWLLNEQSSSLEAMAKHNGIPNSVVYGGKTYSLLFGNQVYSDSNYGWMQGYSKWYSAMFNRIKEIRNLGISLETEHGREILKNWLWNHFGDPDFHSGGVVGLGVGVEGIIQAEIPYTANNQAAGVVGMKYVKTWGEELDHAMVIVGYDDRIEFDLNDNGICGEASADEKGAWIMANTWGDAWANQGFIYCPYKHARIITSLNRLRWGDWFNPNLYYARKDYRPLRTLKIRMNYSHRSEMKLSAGISENLDAVTPDKMILLEHFKFAGDWYGSYLGSDWYGTDAPVPMLGRWADGVHFEPMEFGYDLTDLSAKMNIRKALKYFFIIDTKPTAVGAGKIYDCALMDYEFDKKGIETAFNLPKEGVEIRNAGNQTIISVIAQGEPFNIPRNLRMQSTAQSNVISWSAPMNSPYKLDGYRIYRNGVMVQAVNTSTLSYTSNYSLHDRFAVTAVYKLNALDFESSKTSEVVPIINSKDNIVRKFSNNGFIIPDLFSDYYPELTFEFWTKPETLIDRNYKIGPDWGLFLMTGYSSKSLGVGWSTDERISTKPNKFIEGVWQHVAIVVNKHNITIYINGIQEGSFTSAKNSGIGGFDNFPVGRDRDGGLNGEVDEFRIWDEARTPEQIIAYKDKQILIPQAESHLLAYYQMDTIMVNGQPKLRDAKGSNHAMFCNSAHSELINNTLFKPGVLKADFTIPQEGFFIGKELTLTNNSSPDAVSFKWTLPNAQEKELSVINPIVMFNTPGEHTITLEATNWGGEKKSITKTLTVQPLAKPVASFNLWPKRVVVGDPVSFVNTSTSVGARYAWEMTGAKTPTATTVNVGTSYMKPGSYPVTLKLINEAGTDQISKQMIVKKRTAKADFAVSPSIVLKNQIFNLNDISGHTPENWKWVLESKTNYFTANSQDLAISIPTPGVYNVKLNVSYASGKSEVSKSRALIVCNADAKQCLNFNGGNNQVKFTGPFQDKAPTAFTIEWWMNSRKNISYCHQMGDPGGAIFMKTDVNGEMSLTINMCTAHSGSNYVIENFWTHYAVVYNNGCVSFYQNGILFAMKGLIVSCPAWSQGFTLGGNLYPFAAQIDEFRIWKTARTSTQIKETANSPIENIATAKANGLILYYDFNQNSGDVIDLTGNGYVGVRSNFGPDGDAWSKAEGVFCLDFNENKNVSDYYLRNNVKPFRYINNSFINGTTRFRALETGTDNSPWIMENPTTSVGVNTCFHVDDMKEKALAVSTGLDNFGTLKNHKLYQIVKLPVGIYVLKVNPFAEFQTGKSYLIVAKGKGIPNTRNLKTEAFAYKPLRKKEITFILNEPMIVSLGMLINMKGKKCISLESMQLFRKTYDMLEAPINILKDKAESIKSDFKILSTNNIFRLETLNKKRIIISNIVGIILVDKIIEGVYEIQLPQGYYFVNGQKVFIH